MKKIVFSLFFILLTTEVSGEALNRTVQGEDTYSLKLRAGYHPEFLRIVFEGNKSLISKGLVNQKDNTVIVRFPESIFTIQAGKVPVTYKKYKDRVVFSPGYFGELRAFSLRYPSRLVIDVYLEQKKRDKKPFIEALRERWRKKAELSIKPEQPGKVAKKMKTVVIDPGHGGYESGLVMENYREKNIVLDIAKRLGALIDRGANRSFLTRKSDLSLSLGERVKFTNSMDTEIFLSLHVGRHEDVVLYTPVITGTVPPAVKAFLHNKGQENYEVKTATLANALRQAIAEDFGDDMVSLKPLPYSILSRIEAAALIVELPSFEDAYYIAELKTELANTLYKGLYLYEEATTTN